MAVDSSVSDEHRLIFFVSVQDIDYDEKNQLFELLKAYIVRRDLCGNGSERLIGRLGDYDCANVMRVHASSDEKVVGLLLNVLPQAGKLPLLADIPCVVTLVDRHAPALALPENVRRG
jgi:hypothetical protein